jgi:3-hydroxyisobutyrate dehydrogenase
MAPKGESWLLVGHGSVGSWLAGKIAAKWPELYVLDPTPRVPVLRGTWLNNADPSLRPGLFDFVISCVPPSEAERVPVQVANFISRDTVLFEWNSAAPEVKARIAARTNCHVVDVALLDSLDQTGGEPLVAISGEDAGNYAATLKQLGFQVDVVGTKCGDAALVKFVRSVFMKSLEGLLLEYYSLATLVDSSGIATLSINRNLGQRFEQFTELMLKTNRLHAQRRAKELAEAAEVLGQNGSMPIAMAAVGTLRRSARTWEAAGAPSEGASITDLMAFYRERSRD